MRFFNASKYKNKKTVCLHGHKHDSKAESKLCEDLISKHGENEIIQQPKVYLTSAKILYKPDFALGEHTFWDVKGMNTPVFMLKKRLWKHYGPKFSKLYLIYNKKVQIVFGPNGGENE